MPLNFPSSPTLGQTYNYNNRVYTFNGSTWTSRSTPAIVSATEPTAKDTGDLWFDTVNNTLAIWDGDEWQYFNTTQSIVYPDENGEAAFTSPGTHSWTCPAGVNFVHTVCVGGGGGGGGQGFGGGSGGGGGGLAWRNDVPVVPGQSYTVQVGSGTTSTTDSVTRLIGETSFFISLDTVAAYGGQSGLAGGAQTGGNGGGYFPFGGNGGNGGSTGTADTGGGGGGAGGYTGTGGAGGAPGVNGLSGAGGGAGGGGGGSGSSTLSRGGGGGGVGIFGQGTNGAGGTAAVAGSPGGGGSDGTAGSSTSPGVYGGGGAGADPSGSAAGSGGGGAVRIIWGPNRAFPSTNTGVL